jgi:hypothetical protein
VKPIQHLCNALRFEKRDSQKETNGHYILSLFDNIHPHTKTSDLPNLVSTAESIAINILKLESASITAIQQSNVLKNRVNTQLHSKSKY